MSIIYKALQKTQKNREIKNTSSAEVIAPGTLRWFDMSLIAVIFILLSIIAYAYLPKITLHHTKETAAIKPQPIDSFNEAEFKNKYQVNGVFVSEQNKFVMINSQSFHIGDAVDGFTIVSIDNSNIKLQNPNHAVVLKVPT